MSLKRMKKMIIKASTRALRNQGQKANLDFKAQK
jgi:hypothetical protein